MGYVGKIGSADRTAKRSKWLRTDLGDCLFTRSVLCQKCALFVEEYELPVTCASQESHSLIRLEGESNIASASELKEALLEGLAGGRELHVNLEQLTSLDLSAMQLIWSAGKEAERAGVKFVVALPEALAPAVRQAGFEQFPGLGKHSDPAIEE